MSREGGPAPAGGSCDRSRARTLPHPYGGSGACQSGRRSLLLVVQVRVTLPPRPDEAEMPGKTRWAAIVPLE